MNEKEEAKMSRAEAAGVLLALMRQRAAIGDADSVEALSMAIANIVRRAHQKCRWKAKKVLVSREL